MLSSTTWNEELAQPLELWMDKKISVVTSAEIQTKVQPITEHNRPKNAITCNNINACHVGTSLRVTPKEE